MKKTLKKPSYRPMRMREMETFPDADWQEKLRPADTLGRPDEETVMAQDHAMNDTVTLLGHSLELGQMPSVASFMGYPALQDISQNGLIRACIETVADDMTREFGTVKVKDEDDATVVETMEAQLRKFRVQKILHGAAEMTGYFGGCLLFIDTGVDDNQLQLPLNLSEKSGEMGIGKLAGFRLVDPINVFPGNYNSTNPLKDDFYRPRFWWVMGKRVHASRLIRFVANEVPQLFRPAYNFFGIAQAQILWDYVIHFGQCRHATAEMITKYSNMVLKTNMMEMLFQKGSYAELESRINALARYRNNNSVIALDRDSEDFVNVSAPMSGLTDVGRQALEFLAAINRTPAVKLLGISPSGFNATGESDIRNYYDHVKTQREKLFVDGMRVILHCLQMDAFGEADPSMTFEWNELGGDDEAAKVNIQQTKANVVGAYLDRNIISQEEARQFIVNDENSGLNFIDPDEVPEPQGEVEEGGEMDMASMLGGEQPENEQGQEPSVEQRRTAIESDDAENKGIVKGQRENALERLKTGTDQLWTEMRKGK